MCFPHFKEAKTRTVLLSLHTYFLQSYSGSWVSYSSYQVLVLKEAHMLLTLRRTLENSLLSHRSFFFTKIGPKISELSFKYCWQITYEIRLLLFMLIDISSFLFVLSGRFLGCWGFFHILFVWHPSPETSS